MNMFKVLLVIVIAASGFLYVENTCIQTTVVDVYDRKIPRGFENYTIVQVSDLHNTKFGRKQSKLINKIKKEKPDIIVVTGDLIYSRSKRVRNSLDFINEAVKIAPVYYVIGNHETKVSEERLIKLKQSLTDAGVFILNNQGIELSVKDECINLFGVDDPEKYSDDVDNNGKTLDGLLAEMSSLDPSQYNILLTHRPEHIDVYADYGYDLVFAGHAHGGQIRLPFLGGILAPNQGFFPKYTNGLYENEGTKMIVSRGLGKSIFPFRIFNRPELVVCKLKAEDINR